MACDAGAVRSLLRAFAFCVRSTVMSRFVRLGVRTTALLVGEGVDRLDRDEPALAGSRLDVDRDHREDPVAV